jgi:indole-3-glycerol phosphate synthase
MTFLDTIIEAKRKRVEAAKKRSDTKDLIARAKSGRSTAVPGRFRNALLRSDRINIVAEIKRASPSKGVINDQVDVAELALSYETGGAAAISVLTEVDFFKGSIEDLRTARNATSLPILRKDFIIDAFQIYEAAEAGADAILMIVAALNEDKLREFVKIAGGDLGLDVLLEVHDLDELRCAESIGGTVIGVNNRNLRSFEVSLDVSRKLASYKPSGAILISESGLGSAAEIFELQELGFDAFLIGETLMRSSGVVDELRGLTALRRPI